MSRSTLVVAVAILALSRSAAGQCLDWSSGFGAPGIAHEAHATVVFDDGSGSGPELYVGGSFGVAGEQVVNGIAKWNGARWEALGSGAVGTIYALAVYDDGGGPALYAGGALTSIGGAPAANIGRWDGVAWTPVGGGVDGPIQCLVVHDDGSGTALFAGGDFDSAGGVPAEDTAKWNGTGWSAVGNAASPGDSVRALCVFDDGNGAALYGGGEWLIGGAEHDVAKWDGAVWSPLVNDAFVDVSALTVFDDGGGPALFAGGLLGGGAAALLEWDGTNWTSIGGLGGPVNALCTYDDGAGAGPALYLGGRFTFASAIPPQGIARWNGASFSAVGASTGLEGLVSASRPKLTALGVYDDGSGAGPGLYAFGDMQLADGSSVLGVARYDGGGWSALQTGNVPTAGVRALHAFDDGGGAALYAAGDFRSAGPVHSPAVARWNGSVWSSIGAPNTVDVLTLAHFDDGGGPALYMGGEFTSLDGNPIAGIARWNGSAWSGLGTGIPGIVYSMSVFDDGNGAGLYAAGQFQTAGGVSAKHVARWDGTSWSSLGTGTGGAVFASAVFDDGTGPKLIVGGIFANVGGVPFNRIAAWDGASWSNLGTGMGNQVHALAVFDEGSGPALFAGGQFHMAGGVSVQHVARWNGTAWSSVGAGLPDTVDVLEVCDDGGGPHLYALTVAEKFFRWDGVAWSERAQLDGTVEALATFDDGSGAALYAGGTFSNVDGVASVHIAKGSQPCTCSPASYCTAKTNSLGCTPSIFSTGTPSIASNSFRVKASNVLNNKSGLLFWGFGPNSAPFQGGTMCVLPPTKRTPLQDSAGNPPPNDCSGGYSFHFNASYMSSKNLVAGQEIHCQYWTRDAGMPSGTGLTDGLRFTICP